MSTVTDVDDLAELARREDTGLTVRLLWDADTNDVWLAYADLRDRDTFAARVPAPCALDAFLHPNAFRPRRRAARSAA